MRPPLTAGQKRVLDFVVHQVAETGLAPTQNEVREHFGWSSVGTVAKHLKKLEEKGYVRRTPRATRGIAVVAEEDRLFLAPDLPDAREVLECVLRNLPEFLLLPASDSRLRSAGRLTGLHEADIVRLFRALDFDPSELVYTGRLNRTKKETV